MAVLALGLTGACAKDTSDHKAKNDKKAEQELAVQEMTATGTVTKNEKLKKDGTPMMTWFRLVEENGAEIRLPKGEIEGHVGQKVKVTGMGYTTEKKGKTVRAFKTITAIEKLDAPAVATPAT